MSTILSAAFLALGILLAGSLPWGVLANTNQRVAITWPWAAVLMAIYLAAYWQAIRGKWLFRDLETQCRALVRANAVPLKLWPLALISGLLGFAALLAFLAVMARLVEMPASEAIAMPAEMPFFTAFTLLAMQSVVAGVTEEAAFRGYMQSMIAQQYGLTIAIITNGIWFGLLHFSSHPDHVLMMLPYYVAVATVYGVLTWATNSILPALVLHVVGDVVVLTRWWIVGLPEWQLTVQPLSPVGTNGIDIHFITAMTLLLVFSVLYTLGCNHLRRISRRSLV